MTKDWNLAVKYFQDRETGTLHLARVDDAGELNSEDADLLAVGANKVRVSRLPYGFAEGRKGDTDAHRRFEIRKTRRGMSFVRAGREIETVDVFPKSVKDEAKGLGQWPLLQTFAYHWGVEVQFEPSLDEVFGITNDKQTVRPIEDLWRIFASGALAPWRQIDLCLREEPGDAKLDALIDHLRLFHAKNPNGRAVVVAEDNPTTDYLRDAIEKLTDMQVARKRRTVGAAEELEVQVALLKEALDDFISGEARILVAADAAREGHNLQFADEIIFFALPWSPPDIQQWIGRIDRLGTKGLPANRRIAITPIVVENSIENSILTVLEGTGVFLRSEVFDESEWAAISEAIASAASGVSGSRSAKAPGPSA